jgi:hypothetical protein
MMLKMLYFCNAIQTCQCSSGIMLQMSKDMTTFTTRNWAARHPQYSIQLRADEQFHP